MIDIHSHIIHGVDDGPTNIEQSINMVAEAEKLGIREIIATPHYHEAIFELERVEENFQELLERTQNYDVNISLGCELFLSTVNTFNSRIRNRTKKSRTGRLMIEFPYNANYSDCIHIVGKLKQENITPILAHPERNRNFHHEYGGLIVLAKAGCLIQVDAASIVGTYGIRVKEFAKSLIQMNIADLVASNAHCPSDYSQWYMAAYNNVIQWAGQERASMMFSQNAKSLIEIAQKSAFRKNIKVGEIL
jgi:protein-tyrosine phosphatase